MVPWHLFLDICPFLVFRTFDRIVALFLTHSRIDTFGLKLTTGRRYEWLVRLHMDLEFKDLRLMKEPWYWELGTLHVRFEVMVIADVSQHYRSYLMSSSQTIWTHGFH